MTSAGWRGTAVALPLFFALKIGSGLVLLKASGQYLAPADFPVFTQFLFLAALFNTVAVGGAQNGVIREVAAAPDDGGVALAWHGALTLWRLAGLVLFLPAALLAWPIAQLLTGRTADAWVVPVLALLSFAAGPGQVACSVLAGRGRLVASLQAQAAGLLLGTAAAVWLLVLHRPLSAVLAFAAGPLLTLLVAGAAVRAMHLPAVERARRRAAARRLLGYSGAFVVLALATAAALFGTRAVYRDAFGLDQLGLWLVANRISDTSTQLLGLFTAQVFVPRLAAVGDAAARRRVVVACWAIGIATMGAMAGVFALAPALFVRLLLSAAYLPAIPFILAYLAGDVLRVWVSLAMNAAFADGRLFSYITIELTTLTLICVLTVALVVAGQTAAPAIAYPAGYAVAALLITAAFLRRHPSSAPAPPRG